MRVPFYKMHGAGNDFVVLDERAAPLGLQPHQIVALADRHRGIGCDQLIAIGAHADADAALRFFNPDGGEAGACGNGTRCAADLLMRDLNRDALTLRTSAGDLSADRLPDGRITVDMGPALLGWRDIPLAHEADTLHLPLEGSPAAASMGNPHVTFFGEPLDSAPLRGPKVEHDPLFPQRANVGFAQVLAADWMRLRVWERGAGLTLACGSGACAAVVNAVRRGLTSRRVTVLVDGGTLEITWGENGHVQMAGPVATSFEGRIDLRAFPA